MRDYFELDRTKGDWESTLDKYGIDTVMYEKDASLVEALAGRGWRKVFEGDEEAILTRPGAGCGSGPGQR